MNKNLRLFAIPVSLVLLLSTAILFFYIEDDSKIQPENNMAYFEIVREDYLCEDYCFLEYIVQSNGIILEKREIKEGEEKKIGMNLWHLEKAKAKSLISNARNLLGNYASGGIDCRECAVSHMFYGDANETVAYTVLDSEKPDFMSEIELMTRNSIENAADTDDFFVHFVYAFRNSNAVDYHIFSDGLVLKELFGDKNGELIESDMFNVSSGEMTEIRSYVNEEIFIASESSMVCNRRELIWGFFEVKKGENYNYKYTCGGENNAADRFFDELYNKMALKQK